MKKFLLLITVIGCVSNEANGMELVKKFWKFTLQIDHPEISDEAANIAVNAAENYALGKKSGQVETKSSVPTKVVAASVPIAIGGAVAVNHIRNRRPQNKSTIAPAPRNSPIPPAQTTQPCIPPISYYNLPTNYNPEYTQASTEYPYINTGYTQANYRTTLGNMPTYSPMNISPSDYPTDIVSPGNTPPPVQYSNTPPEVRLVRQNAKDDMFRQLQLLADNAPQEEPTVSSSPENYPHYSGPFGSAIRNYHFKK